MSKDASKRKLRRLRDVQAYRVAQSPAAKAVRDLLRALDHPGATPRMMTRLSRHALGCVGLLWEAAARLSE